MPFTALQFASPAPFPRSVVRRPLFASLICAGFPSPADDHRERTIDLNEELIRNEPATFFLRILGQSGHDKLTRDGFVRDGDLVIMDRSLTPQNGDVIIATIAGESFCKRFRKEGKRVWLESANREYPTIVPGPETEMIVEGVITYSIHRQRGA